MAGEFVHSGKKAGEKMRLVCPNCGAQYEVDDRVMPENGRDVQCSACGHAWFQRGPLSAEAEEHASDLIEGDATPAGGEADHEIIDETPAPPTETENTESSDTARDDAADARQDETQDDPANPTLNTPPQRALSSDVTSILQEEAERELEARQSEQEQLETQTEMGLDDVNPDEAHRQSIRERMARLRGAEDEFEATEALPEGRSRDLLPDIEEINSTLDANHEDHADEEEDIPVQTVSSGGGFRRGFLMVLIFAALLVALYVYTPLLGDALPALTSPLDQYVGFVDQIRITLNTMIEAAITKMQGLAGGG